MSEQLRLIEGGEPQPTYPGDIRSLADRLHDVGNFEMATRVLKAWDRLVQTVVQAEFALEGDSA